MDKTRTASHVEGASLAHRGSCDCGSTSAPDALSEFLSLLSNRHLSELARQCEIDEKQTVGRAQLVRSILAFRLRRPDRDLRISNGAKLRNMMVPSGGPHLLGKLDVSLLKRVSMATNKLSIQSTPTLELDPSYEHRVDFVLRAPATWASFFSGMTFGCALVQPQLVMSGLTIGAGEVLVVDLPYLRIEGKLTLGQNARVFGVHPCGLEVSCRELHADSGALISTSMRSEAVSASHSLAGDGFPNLFKYEDGAFLETSLPSGATGAAGVDRGLKKGDDGEHARCWPLAPTSPAEDGEDVGDGLAGGTGGQGGGGAATRSLRLTVDDSIEGKVLLSTQAGNGGRGGKGGAGESVEGGAGGNAPMFGCPFDAQGKYPQPGRGGKAGKGGDAGSGGNGGTGGDAGWIWIRVPGLSPGAVQSSVQAISRGGAGGSGGPAHANPFGEIEPGGSSVGGDPGKWVLPGGAGPIEQSGDAGLPGQWGGFAAKGVQGQNGARGCNGQISVWTDAGWEVEVAPNHELQPQNWSWPTVEPSTT